MKQYKILTAAMAVAVLSGVSAMAQFNYQNGDLLVGFGNAGSTDVIVDLGAISNFQQPGATASWNLSSVLNATYGSVSGSIYWAVFGANNTTQAGYNASVVQANAYTAWDSIARSTPSVQNSTPNVSGNANSQHLAVNQIATIVGYTDPNSANAGLIVDYAPGIEQVSTTLGGYTSLMNPDGNLGGTWSYNMLNHGAGTSDFYQSDPGNPFVASQNYLGNFTLDNTGTLTFNAVPEPSTWAMVGSGMLALLALRRRK